MALSRESPGLSSLALRMHCATSQAQLVEFFAGELKARFWDHFGVIVPQQGSYSTTKRPSNNSSHDPKLRMEDRHPPTQGLG